MIITIDTAAGLSELDRATLSTLLERTGSVQAVEVNVQGDPDLEALKKQLEGNAEKLEEKVAPRRRAAAKKAAEPVAEEAPEEPADETPEAVEEDTPAVLEEEPAAAEEEFTLADAVAVASPLISAGKGATIKKILTAHGVKRVGELPAEKIASFIADLNKLEAESGE